jgi:hypothetical protein
MSDYDWNTAAVVRLTERAERAEAEVEHWKRVADARFGGLCAADAREVALKAERDAALQKLAECDDERIHQHGLAEAARADAARLMEALAGMEDACAAVASWSSESVDYSDPARVAARAALAGTPEPDRIYPCADCGKMRSKAEGGTTFTVCDVCWDKKHPNAPSDRDMRVAEAVREECARRIWAKPPKRPEDRAMLAWAESAIRVVDLTTIVKGVR